MKVLLTLLFCLVLVPIKGQTVSKYTYSASDEDFNNPERGFYRNTFRKTASDPFYYSVSMEDYWKVGFTLIYRVFYLPEFVDRPISDAYLNKISEDFQVIRDAGMKAVIRFAYTDKSSPPYGDATPARVMEHVAQLKPLLQENADVILVLQAGFIGAWGEWGYTDHFATGSPNNITSEDLEEREELVYALLDALPLNRQVQLRTPLHKRRIFGDVPLSDDQAYNYSPKSRIGYHNDCFLASPNDAWTYVSDIDRAYLEKESKYTSMGGETCRWFPERSNCDTAGHEVDLYNWSFINYDFEPVTIQQWKDNGCYDQFRKSLGYRYRLIEASFDDSAAYGGSFTGRVEIINEGYANPINERQVEIILRHQNTGQEFVLQLDLDIRKMPKGESFQLLFEGGINEGMPPGVYDLFLNLPDPMPKLRGNPRYSIRMANADIWEAISGYNIMTHKVYIDNKGNGESYKGNNFFMDVQDSIMIILYPNPAIGYITLLISNPNILIKQISVMDVSGKLLNTSTIKEAYGKAGIVIPIEKLSPGRYIIRIDYDGGSITRVFFHL